ncbi:hypothetical protein [Paenibacillus thalictri]|uniref:Uncharacterized protein n=1 Tax=Paenibacillus thalictri TaxID=2527873 RepID=A0A4Q9DTR8_9BACL|nr:hypothetical protein [Paenibacillus thalictri]TBL80308.1 hypothetical protein EYB31_07775 [Paenibacillus thalictri]
MCRNTVNVSEVQLALRQLEDLVKNVNAYIMSWGIVVATGRADAELQQDFSETAILADQLRKKIHQLQHKLDEAQELEARPITITHLHK